VNVPSSSREDNSVGNLVQSLDPPNTGAATLLHSGQVVEAVAVIAAGLFIVAVLYGR
jgi:hypothetical protein